MNYVAFLDILGFSNTVESSTHSEAGSYLESFKNVLEDVWVKNSNTRLNGLMASDSFIISSIGDTSKDLTDLLEMVKQVCETEFIENHILIRGGISKGDFSYQKQPSKSNNLSYEIIFGRPYIDAYNLEGSYKVVAIMLDKVVFEDIKQLKMPYNCYEGSSNQKKYFFYVWLEDQFLISPANLSIFLDLAKKAKWLEHYYNTLYFFVKKEENKERVALLFESIFESLGDPFANHRDISLFIKNAFVKDVEDGFQEKFLTYLRSRIYPLPSPEVDDEPLITNNPNIAYGQKPSFIFQRSITKSRHGRMAPGLSGNSAGIKRPRQNGLKFRLSNKTSSISWQSSSSTSTTTCKKIIAYLIDHPQSSVRSIAWSLKIPVQTVCQSISRLEAEGKLISVSVKPAVLNRITSSHSAHSFNYMRYSVKK